MLPQGVRAAASVTGTGAECELSWAEPGWQESWKPTLVSFSPPRDLLSALLPFPGLARQ